VDQQNVFSVISRTLIHLRTHHVEWLFQFQQFFAGNVHVSMERLFVVVAKQQL
jgi:hypothetical protein